MLNLKKKKKDDESKNAEKEENKETAETTETVEKEDNKEKVEKEEEVENKETVEKEEKVEKENVELPVKEEGGKEVSRKEIDTLKADVENLSGELNSAVTNLKDSVVDIRSAVSEIENPFNLLRAIQGDKDVQDLNRNRMPKGVQSLVLSEPNEEPAKTEEPEDEALDEPPKPEPEPEPKIEPKPEPKPEPVAALPEEPPKTQITPQPEKVLPPQPQRQTLKGTSDFLDWVWAHIDSGLTADDIFALAKSYEFLGYLPENFGEGIYHLARAAEKMKAGGFNKMHLLLNMYQAASISGIPIGLPDVNKLISIVEGKTKTETRTETTRNE